MDNTNQDTHPFEQDILIKTTRFDQRNGNADVRWGFGWCGKRGTSCISNSLDVRRQAHRP